MSLWNGRFTQETDEIVKQFTSSIEVDKKLYLCDITGSIAHARMLAHCGIIRDEEAEKIKTTLEEIKEDISSAKIDLSGKEDIHMAIEEELIKRAGTVGEKLHTARSRNDQICLDERLYLREEIDTLQQLIHGLQKTFLELAEKNRDTILPGYTHLQYAQPVLLAHHLLAYFWMLKRDSQRFSDCRRRVNIMPLGSGALAGTALPIDRDCLARLLDFPSFSENSMDAVSDRDYLIELLACLSLVIMHLSRFAEDLVIWSSPPFSFIEISDAFTTGSSLMPQKKNPDVAELIRGKTGIVYGYLISLLVTLKGLPLSYNRDLQEDKYPLFQALRETKTSLEILAKMLKSIKVNFKRMRQEAEKGFFAATDLVEYLVEKGLPFRRAHQLVGKMIRFCLEKNLDFAKLTLSQYQEFSTLFEKDVFLRITLEECVFRKNSPGGTGRKSVAQQILLAKKELRKE